MLSAGQVNQAARACCGGCVGAHERLPQHIHQATFAHAGLAIDIHQPGELSGEDRRDRVLELGKLIGTTDQRAGV